MKIYEIMFSPTGGTAKAADILTAEAGQTAEKIDLSVMEADIWELCFEKEDVCVAAVPSFAGRVPEVAASRLSRMKGNGARVILLVAFGNRAYDDTLLELKEIMERAGFCPVAAVAAVAEHSIMHQYGAGRPDQEDRKELKQFAEKIWKNVLQEELRGRVEVPGEHPYRDSKKLPFQPKPGKKCTKCGLCVEACPVGAIAAGEPDKVDEELCITCMKCAEVCPEGARGINQLVLAAAAQSMKKVCGVHKKNELWIAEG